MSINNDIICKICGNCLQQNDFNSGALICGHCESVRKLAEQQSYMPQNTGWPDSKEMIILLNNILFELKEINKKLDNQQKSHSTKVLID